MRGNRARRPSGVRRVLRVMVGDCVRVAWLDGSRFWPGSTRGRRAAEFWVDLARPCGRTGGGAAGVGFEPTIEVSPRCRFSKTGVLVMLTRTTLEVQRRREWQTPSMKVRGSSQRDLALRGSPGTTQVEIVSKPPMQRTVDGLGGGEVDRLIDVTDQVAGHLLDGAVLEQGATPTGEQHPAHSILARTCREKVEQELWRRTRWTSTATWPARMPTICWAGPSGPAEA